MKIFWPILAVLSALVSCLVYFIFTDIPGRPLILLWFLIVCPGMLLIRFFRLREPLLEWSLAVTLSMVIDTAIASVQMYSGLWSPSLTLLIVTGLCCTLALLELILSSVHPVTKGGRAK